VSHPRMAAMTQPLFDRTRSIPARELAGTSDPDRELVETWRKGELEAFAALVRRHQRRVFGLLLRMLGNREDAEDAAQDTFLNLHRHGHRFRFESRFSTFVYRVAVNAALNRRRSLGRRRTQTEAFGEVHAVGQLGPKPGADPEASLIGDRLRARLTSEVLALPEALRAPVILFDIEGLSYSEISEVLEVAEGTVKSRIHRARQALRTRLRDLVAPAGSGS